MTLWNSPFSIFCLDQYIWEILSKEITLKTAETKEKIGMALETGKKENVGNIVE